MPASDIELILLGAGASQEAGIPPAKKLVPKIRELLRQDPGRWSYVGRAIDTAIGGLMQYNATLGDPFAEVDIESLFATLDELGERRSNVLAPFVAAWSQPVDAAASETQEAQVNEVVRGLEADMEKSASDAIRAAELRRAPNIRLQRFRLALRDLFRSTSGTPSDPFQFATQLILQELLQLCWVADATRVEYLLPLVKATNRKRLWIATLNFDNTIELAAATAGVTCDLGITGDYRPIEFSNDSPLTLAKLHGSVNWSRPDPWRIEIKDRPDLGAALIFGAGNKLRVEGPYLDLLLAFRSKLETVNHLIVCGYSFRDDHINHTLVRWLQLNSSVRMSIYGLDISMQSVTANLNAHLGLTTLTKNRITLPPTFLATRAQIFNMKAGEWVRHFTAS
jgi:hypothetical protein